MSNESNHMDPDRLLRYLAGELSDQERHELERQLEKDPFAREALEGMEMAGAEKAREDILSLHRSLRKRLGRRRRIGIYGMAAAIASLLIVGSFFLHLYDFHPSQKELERDYLHSDQPESSDIPEDRTVAGDEKEITPPMPQKQEAAKKEARTMEVPPPSPGAEAREAANKEEPYEKDLQESSPEEEVVHVEAEPYEPSPRAPARARRSKGMTAQPSAGVQQDTESMAPGLEKGSVNVSGMIISGDDLKPLPGATVRLKGSDVSTASDSVGRFDLPVKDIGNPILVADFTGMDSREVPVYPGQEVKIVMEPSLVSLQEVVVPENLTEQKQESISGVSVKETDRPPESGTYSPAEPAIGFDGFTSYVEKNIRLPVELESGKKEVVVLRFTVTSNGNLTDIDPVRSPGETYTKEAIRLLLEGPAWNPARTGQVPEDDLMRIRITFRRESN